MKAILDKDRIINFSELGTVVLPTLPKRVALDRIRWDGTKIVDLGKLSQIWVEYANGHFILHAIEVPNSQLVTMTYTDRKDLILDNGIIRLKTALEKMEENRAISIGKIKSVRDRKLKGRVGILVDIIVFLLKLNYLTTKSLRTQNTQLLAVLDTYLTKMHDIYGNDADTVTDVVAIFDKIKEILIEYESDIGGV